MYCTTIVSRSSNACQGGGREKADETHWDPLHFFTYSLLYTYTLTNKWGGGCPHCSYRCYGTTVYNVAIENIIVFHRRNRSVGKGVMNVSKMWDGQWGHLRLWNLIIINVWLFKVTGNDATICSVEFKNISGQLRPREKLEVELMICAKKKVFCNCPIVIHHNANKMYRKMAW